MTAALLRGMEAPGVGDSERLVAAVLAAAREQLRLDLRYDFDAPDVPTAIPVEARDGRQLGSLIPQRPLSAAEKRAVKALAAVLANRLGRPEWADEQLRTAAQRVRAVMTTEDAIRIALQPIVDLRSDRPVGYEALARFPSTPALSPEVWFADAEAAGLGRQLEIAAATVALERLAELPPNSFLAINTSPAVAVDRCLREAMRGLPHDRIVLEMTEHAPVDDYDDFERRLDRRRGEGVRLAIDDVGAGFASLRHILRLRPSLIKLDISLVRGIDHDPLRQSLARSLVEFARSLEADVLAEGIESTGELEQVGKLGIAFGQGFLLGRPQVA
jgi:EAL domain-containing protein (putative c-di-GMP-specific phosphodiesterase class I)